MGFENKLFLFNYPTSKSKSTADTNGAEKNRTKSLFIITVSQLFSIL